MNNETCGCCEGTEKLTPQKIVNRPGLSALIYRVGTHATFLQTMLARLSDLFLDVTDSSGSSEKKTLYPLRGLKTRNRDDAAIAFLDSWATVADVLTFYQERIANEGFLRTAIERRSVLELARMIGYKLRPGVAATAYLAFELDKDQSVEIPKGVRAQSLPGPGEMPQTFETSQALEARFEWNALRPRLTRPQAITKANGRFIPAFYFQGISTNLKPNDLLLLVFENTQALHLIQTVELQTEKNLTKATPPFSFDEFKTRFATTIEELKTIYDTDDILDRLKTKVGDLKVESYERVIEALNDAISELEMVLSALISPNADSLKSQIIELIGDLREILLRVPVPSSQTSETADSAFNRLRKLIKPTGLMKPPSLQPINPLRRSVSVSRSFSDQSDIGPQLLVAQRPELKQTLYDAWRQVAVTPSAELKSVHAFRVKAAVFGHNVPKRAILSKGNITEYDEWSLSDTEWTSYNDGTDTTKIIDKLSLDGIYDGIKPDSWVIIKHTDYDPKFLKVNSVEKVFRSDYGISANVTRLQFSAACIEESWIEVVTQENVNGTTTVITGSQSISVLRKITIYAQSEPLELAEEPIEDLVEGKSVELDGLFDGLKSGRWLVVSGERTDLTEGSQSDKVRASELVMLVAATQDANPDLPGDTPHTTLHFANSLAYKYQRNTVTINANVAHATHGETRSQVLGSGDSSKALQEFKLSFSPLTYVPAVASTGIESTLEVRVNDLLWRESDNLSEFGPTDRRYVTRQDNEGNTFVSFGNGERGARLPSGVENVKAAYRSGIGKSGNVAAEQISLLSTRPLGVKGVRNPQPATGGADAEGADNGRRNATVPLKALDRAVSLQDYADFARAFAGIGKASARRLSDGRRELVHLTITGADDIPISRNSDLYRNLRQALYYFGDPHQALQIDTRDLLLIVVSARVKIFPEFLWESVEPRIRAAVLEALGFPNRDLGQDVFRSELISTVEAVEGVDYVDVDNFDALSQDTILDNLELLSNSIGLKDSIAVELARVDLAETDPEKRIKPAQLAYLTPAIPDTLILTELT
jgi:predicted phage baseplate assembly protein